MSNSDTPGTPPAQQVGEREVGPRPDDGEAPVSPASAEDRSGSSRPKRNTELLCTICGLRACWQ
jgi:hypothetical protein